MIIMLTVVIVVFLVLGVLGIALWGDKLGDIDVHLTNGPAPETGKLVEKGGDIVDILFNSKSGYYERDGEWVDGKRQYLGLFFKTFGRTLFGFTPIHDIFRFDVSWGDYTREGSGLPSIKFMKDTGCTVFKRFYTHAIEIKGSEMAKEGAVDGKDTSTTRIDAFLYVTVKITNILDSIFKIPPQGMVFAHINGALTGAFNDYVKGRQWQEFREEDKITQGCPFVQYIIGRANPVLRALGLGMEITIVELKFFDLSGSIENEELAKSQTKLLVAENEGAALVALAKKQATADALEGRGRALGLRAVKAVIGEENIGEYAALEQVQGTSLQVYNRGGGQGATPVIDVSKGKGEKK